MQHDNHNDNSVKTIGKVYLIGAGPGDAGLLTLRGRELLGRAQVLLYDRLSSPALLQLAPPECERISVGKRVGDHAMRQEEINRRLVEKALEGKRVVRLKGGDPFVFGRGGEEILALREQGIPYEVVPGITSAVGALEAAGIPVTHRGVARSFHVITGHTAEEYPEASDPFLKYAALEGTLVFLMGIGHLDRIVQGLLAGGRNPSTPAAIVEQGTTIRQRRIDGTLGSILGEAARALVCPPAILVVGEAAAFHMEPQGEGLPLAGKKVGITGTVHMTGRLGEILRELGATVYEAPYLDIRDTDMLERCRADRGNYQWFVFTSPNGVKAFFRQLQRIGTDIRSLAHLKYAVIGAGTERELWKYGIHADYVPAVYTVRDLAEGLAQRLEPGERVCALRAVEASDDLEKVWDALPVNYAALGIYETVVSEEILAQLRGQSDVLDYITFASASGVRAYFADGGDHGFRGSYVCIGEKTHAELLKYGPQIRENPVLLADVQTAEGMVRKIVETEEKQRRQV